MRVIKTLTLIACSLFLPSCLKAVTEDIPLDYIPRAQSVRSGPFLADGDDLLIVTVNGATLQPVLERGHFSLTRDNRDVPLPASVRGGDGYVLFGFDQPLERSHNFRLTVRPAAVTGGGSVRTVTVQAISSGQWTNIENTVFENYAVRSVGYGNGRFIAAGDSGRMAHSVDGGRNWVSVESGTGLAGNKFVSTVYAVAFGASLFYAVGADARMSFSVNGVNWTGHRLPGPTPPPSEPPPPPVYGEVLFAGEAGLKDVRAVVFGRGPSALDGRFVAAGADGRATFWNPGMSVWAAGTGIEPEHKIKTLAWGNVEGGRFIAAGTDGAVYRATDGTGTQSWQRAGDSTFGDNTVNASVFGNGVFVIGGNAGRMARSNNGLEWNAVDSSVIGDSDVLSLAFGSGLFVAGTCSGILAWSANGIDWESIPDGGFGPGERVNGIATNGRGRFVAAGNCSAGKAGRTVSWYQRPMAHSQTGGGE